MKKLLVLLVIIGMIFSTTGVVYADYPLKKLGRGLCNVITCPFEIPRKMGEATDESGELAGWTWGLLNGTFWMAIRAFVGVYETATFPIPIPKDYEPILTDPEFFLEEKL
jgi:putative exosortase-associated protein (TIGR04073 family)